ncbi:MAG: CvpA family protein [Syntrophomonadaceae bacterium]|jgi:uncharacterized membrane protein required for colicin V production|nr:CvpA family protein [Syntrophomonadaceae bacterium]
MDLNLFDYLILTIIAFSGWSGFRKGFLHALGSIISLAVGIMLSIMYYRNLAAYLQDYYGVTGSLAESIRSKIPMTALKLNQEQIINGLGLGDASNYLAHLLVMALCFIAIFLLASKLTQFLWLGIESVMKWGGLSPIDAFLGVVLAISQNLIILSITLGLLYPALLLASKMGFYSALVVVESIDKSLSAAYMLHTYELLKAWIGIS